MKESENKYYRYHEKEKKFIEQDVEEIRKLDVKYDTKAEASYDRGTKSVNDRIDQLQKRLKNIEEYSI